MYGIFSYKLDFLLDEPTLRSMIYTGNTFINSINFCFPSENSEDCPGSRRLFTLGKKQYLMDNLNQLGLGSLIRHFMGRYRPGEVGNNRTTKVQRQLQAGLDKLFGKFD